MKLYNVTRRDTTTKYFSTFRNNMYYFTKMTLMNAAIYQISWTFGEFGCKEIHYRVHDEHKFSKDGQAFFTSGV